MPNTRRNHFIFLIIIHTIIEIYTLAFFNLFNYMAATFLQKNGIVMGTASLELAFEQVKGLVENSPLPIEVIVHGSYESMICDHNFAAMQQEGPRKLGVGVYRFRQSQNSL